MYKRQEQAFFSQIEQFAKISQMFLYEKIADLCKLTIFDPFQIIIDNRQVAVIGTAADRDFRICFQAHLRPLLHRNCLGLTKIVELRRLCLLNVKELGLQFTTDFGLCFTVKVKLFAIVGELRVPSAISPFGDIIVASIFRHTLIPFWLSLIHISYKALIDWDRTDREYVTAIIELRVTPKRDLGFEGIAETVMRFEEVESVYLMSGGYDLSVVVNGRTFKDVAMFCLLYTSWWAAR